MLLSFYSHKQTFDREQQRAESEGSKFTLCGRPDFVGPNVSSYSLCPTIKTFRGIGLKCHKTSCLRDVLQKTVTGVVVTEKGLCLPNRRHLGIAQGIHALGSESKFSSGARTYCKQNYWADQRSFKHRVALQN